MQQLDTETNVTEHYTLRELYVIQLGTYAAYMLWLGWLFADKEIVFLAHNAKFEQHGIIQTFRNIRKEFKDTFLASKLITAGLEVPKGYNGLASLVLHRFGVDLSKAQFYRRNDDSEQLLYADTDVLYLGKLLEALMGPKKSGSCQVF
jgi:ribonuclease D